MARIKGATMTHKRRKKMLKLAILGSKQGLGQFFNLLVFHFKLLLQP